MSKKKRINHLLRSVRDDDSESSNEKIKQLAEAGLLLNKRLSHFKKKVKNGTYPSLCTGYEPVYPNADMDPDPFG